MEAMDQPSIDGVNTWFVAKAGRERGLKVAISGLGGDELFGGYPSFRDIPMWARRFAPAKQMPGLGRFFRAAISKLPVERFGLSPKTAGLLELGGSFPGAYLLRRGLFMPWELQGMLDPATVAEGLEKLDILGRIASELQPDPGSDFAKVAVLESSLYMRNQLLRDTDWASMSHSLEVRTPLVDSKLLETMAELGHANNAKAELAQAPIRPLPDSVISRKKTGFAVPLTAWTNSRANYPARRTFAYARSWAQHLAADAGCRLAS
jgi:asparagine synthase (glutamine-hydrolysing)